MEMPGRRSNYTLLSQVPDDQTAAFYESESKNNKGKTERGFEWETGADFRANRVGNPYSSVGLQRQSSGSSFGESSLSGEYYAPTLSNTAANEIDGFGYVPDDVFKVGGGGEFRMKGGDGAVVTTGGGGSSSGKSWAQQTEESYQLQLALALRLSSEATCADDPNFLDLVPDVSASRSSGSVDAVSHRFWVGFLVLSVLNGYF